MDNDEKLTCLHIYTSDIVKWSCPVLKYECQHLILQIASLNNTIKRFIIVSIQLFSISPSHPIGPILENVMYRNVIFFV